MRTISDEKLQSARDHVRAALKDLSEVVIDRCSGHDEYTSEYQKRLRTFFLDLLNMRDSL